MIDQFDSSTILVIDNDKSFGESLAKDVLQPEGFHVECFTNTADANEFLRTHLVHLAIVDVRLENDDNQNDRSGLDFCKKLEPLVARIILTGFPEGWGLVREALLSTPIRHRLADGFIYKSDENMQRDLLAEIRRVLHEEFEIIPKKRIGVLTSGGDSPGMNAAIRTIVHTAMLNDIEVIGILDGYKGMIKDRMIKFRWNDINDILTESGTILGSTRYKNFEKKEVREKAVDTVIRKQITGLIVIGGDGSMRGAQELAHDLEDLKPGVVLHTVGIPGTIDNDIWGTDMSLGAASAANAMTDVLRNMLHPAQALRRVFVCQVMGRYSGYLALEAALGIGADAVILPEQVVVTDPPQDPMNPGPWVERVKAIDTKYKLDKQLDEVAEFLKTVFASGKRYAYVVLGEGICQLTIKEKGVDTNLKLDADYVARHLQLRINQWNDDYRPDVRDHILGHPVRGVSPSRFDIWLGTALGAEAVQCLIAGKTNIMLGWREEEGIKEVAFEEVTRRSNRPPNESWVDRPKWQEMLRLQQATACPPSLREALKKQGNRFVI